MQIVIGLSDATFVNALVVGLDVTDSVAVLA